MKTTNIVESGVNVSGATQSAMYKIKEVLTSYNNITFAESITISTGRRDVYSVDGIENLRFTIENKSASNGYLTVRIYDKDNIQGTTYFCTYDINCTYTNVLGASVWDNPLYTFSKNNNLYAFMIAPKGSIPSGYVVFESNYIHSNEYAIKDVPVQYWLNRYSTNYSYSVNEKALYCKGVITQGQTTSTTPLMDVSNVICKFVNAQFSTQTFALIEVDGVRYRQIYGNYSFIEDGDTE